MNSTAIWETEELETALATVAQPEDNGLQSDENGESATAPNKLTTLKELVLRLLTEVQCIDAVNALTLDGGVDFYDEVSRFEIDLIRRALLQTGGHQVQAAKLLNLKVTTLNSKIKHYSINPTGFTNVYPTLVEATAIEERQHA
jgi:transcriptional regulator with GAF, ATPase, and Fis domain